MQKQDFSYPSCGCVFKNPDNFAAGFLIDACGLKGLSKNGAKVSNKHANFILNTGNATYNDVDYLISQVRGKVYQKFSILLEEEIERWG
jgi:UDP-N-acetylmuramate dehydrogenase